MQQRYTFLVKEDPLDLRKAKAILEAPWMHGHRGTFSKWLLAIALFGWDVLGKLRIDMDWLM